METFFESSQTVLDFLTLLQVEQGKKNSDLFDARVWQDLTKLDKILETVNTTPEIANAILDWCEQHSQINQRFNQTNWSQLRIDLDDEMIGKIPSPSPTTDAEVVYNKSEIQRIIKSQQPLNPQNNRQS